ncbi:MAG: HNH endonuclease signature motif containing protein [Acidobacteriota bacterium]
MKDQDEIISHHEMVAEEKYPLQRGMNYRVGQGGRKGYSVLLMSLRKNAVYEDEIDSTTGYLIYQGHDAPRAKGVDPKTVDQPILTPKGIWTENGKFFRAAVDYKSGLRDPELVKVYEKIDVGVWSVKGFYQLVDVKQVHDGKRNVWKFYLKPVERKAFNKIIELPHTRIIPTHVKIQVWQRDRGRCRICGSHTNLGFHYDHDIAFAKGGSSLTADNIQLLCEKCNLQKSDKIMSLFPWLILGPSVMSRLCG